MQDLNVEMTSLRETMNNAIDQAVRIGKELARIECEYSVVRAKKMLILRDSGMPVTLITNVVKGDKEVAELRLERDTQEVLYKLANERIMGTKLEIKVVSDEMNNIRRGV